MAKAKEKLTSDTFLEFTLVLLITAFICLIGNLIYAWAAARGAGPVDWGANFVQSVPGLLILCGISWVGLVMGAAIPGPVPSIIWITVIGIVLSVPGMPTSKYVIDSTSKIALLATCTPVLAYAGVSMGKDWAEFKKIGWRGVLVSGLVMFGTFFGSAVVAEIILKIQGII
ncbi:MAG: hypothetical protein LKJ25_07385 [Clostridia bacterium]|jgi:hypothetical protein|nr:hypothetical protein [Clostridia bacterium]